MSWEKGEKCPWKFPAICIGCGAESDLTDFELDMYSIHHGEEYHTKGRFMLCARCEETVRHQRKFRLIGGGVCIGACIMVFALGDLLISVVGLGFLAFLFGFGLAAIFFFLYAHELEYLPAKYVQMKGIIKDKVTKTWKPKLVFKNPRYKFIFDELNGLMK